MIISIICGIVGTGQPASAGNIVMAQASGTDGEMEIAGIVIDGGVECPLFRTDDADVFAIQGIAKTEAPVGTRMRLRGSVAMMSTCQQGTAFAVTSRLD